MNKKLTISTSSLLKGLVVSFTLCLSLIGGYTTQAEGLNVAVYPIHSKKQITEDNYFNLLVKPGEKDKLQLKFENLSDEDVTVEVNVMTAGTTSNGSVDYTKINPILNDSLEYSLNDLFKEKKKDVILKKQESKVVDFEYEIPKEEFEGSLLGSFYITEKKDETTTFEFKYSQVIAIQMRESKKQITPKFDLAKIDLMQYNKQASFMITIENQKPLLLKGADITGKISKNESKVIKFDFETPKQDIAPNSNLIFPVPLPDDIGIDAGIYTLKLTINDKGTKYEYEKEFDVTALALQNAGYVEPEETSLMKSSFFVVIVIIFVIILIAVLAYVFLVLKNPKNTKRKLQIKSKKKPKKDKR